MKPFSKIIQIVSHPVTKIGGDERVLIVLCEDGSVYQLTLDGKFILVAEMDGNRYA